MKKSKKKKLTAEVSKKLREKNITDSTNEGYDFGGIPSNIDFKKNLGCGG